MNGRRKSPDGMPFRLYRIDGKFKVSFYYKLPDNTRAFTLAARAGDARDIAEKRAEAVRRADMLNGNAVEAGTVASLVDRYFLWQKNLKPNDGRRKAASTLEGNKPEAKNLVKVFGAMLPEQIKTKHVYGYLAARADNGAPAKANKEIALLSAILEYARTRGELEQNPCRDIRYNPTTASTKLVEDAHLELALSEARKRGGQYHVLGLCFYVAYLTTSRPSEMRSMTRASITAEGLKIPIGKKRATQVQKYKLVQWSPALRTAVDEALSLQRTASMFVFGNTEGQEYSRSGWGTIWTRLMKYCEARAKAENLTFERFALKDMRPMSVTERVSVGETNIINATGHVDERMIRKTYDRNTVRKTTSTK
jgi:hypothetical protein